MIPALIAKRCGSAFTYGILLSSLYLYLTHSLGVAPENTGLYLAALVFANHATALPASRLAEIFGPGRVMLLGCALDVIAYALLYGWQTPSAALAAVTLLGTGGCLFSMHARHAMLHAETTAGAEAPRQATARQGLYLRWTNAGALAGPVLAGFLIAHQLLHAGFLLCLAVELLLAAVLLKHLPATPANLPAPARNRAAPPPAGFWFAHLFAALPLALAASGPILVPYLFAELRHRPDLIAPGQLARSAAIILLQIWASEFFPLKRNARLCLAMLAVIALAATTFSLTDLSLPSAWFLAVALGITQLAAASLITSLTPTAGGEAAPLPWSRAILAIPALVLLPLIPECAVLTHRALASLSPTAANALAFTLLAAAAMATTVITRAARRNEDPASP